MSVEKSMSVLELEQPAQHYSKGEKTKNKILIATIEVLALNGIKGTTHRAIASHAQLQLSLTTYYFKDIQELIDQAFRQNSYLLLSRVNKALETAFLFIGEINRSELKKVVIKKALCQRLSTMISKYLIANIKQHAISLAVEQLMFTEIQVSPRLRFLAQEHDLAQLVHFEQLCRYFNKIDPEIDARIMHNIFSQLQYSQLTKQQNIDVNAISKTTYKVISWIMGLK